MVMPPKDWASNAKSGADEGNDSSDDESSTSTDKGADDGKPLRPLSKNTFGNRYWSVLITSWNFEIYTYTM